MVLLHSQQCPRLLTVAAFNPGWGTGGDVEANLECDFHVLIYLSTGTYVLGQP